jgi:hypothetical protein
MNIFNDNHENVRILSVSLVKNFDKNRGILSFREELNASVLSTYLLTYLHTYLLTYLLTSPLRAHWNIGPQQLYNC